MGLKPKGAKSPQLNPKGKGGAGESVPDKAMRQTPPPAIQC